MRKNEIRAYLQSLTFRQREQSFTRDLSGRYSTHVVIAPTGTSYTDGQLVVLDSLCGEDRNFDLHHRMRLARANNIHETYHLIETDLEHYLKWTKGKRNEIASSFLNIVEDAWIEWSCSQKTPVYYREIVWLNECLIRGAMKNMDNFDQGDKLVQYQNLCLMYLVGKEDFSSKASEEVKIRFQEAKKIGDLLFQWKGFQYRIEVTEEILNLVQDWLPNSNTTGTPNGLLQFHMAPGQKNELKHTEQVQAAPLVTQKPLVTPNKGNKRKKKQDDSLSQASASGSPNGELDAHEVGKNDADDQSQQGNQKLIEQIKQEIDETADRQKLALQHANAAGSVLDQNGYTSEIISTSLLDSKKSIDFSHLISRYQSALQETVIGVSNLNREISVLRSENQEWETGKISGTRVDLKRVWRNSSEVMMRRRIQETTFDPAFTIMMDFSGSTNGGGIHQSYRQVCLMFREFCKSWNIPLAAYGHWIDGNSKQLNIYPIQHFESEQRDPLNWSNMQAKTNARDDLAIIWGSDYMVRSQIKADKILFVMADGEPNHYVGPNDNYTSYTARATNQVAINKAKAKGVEVISIGIGVDLSQYFEHSIFVNHPSDVAKQLGSIVRERIRGY